MNFKIEFRFGIIIALMYLFWYSMEYVLGYHTKAPQYHLISSLLYNIPLGAYMIYSIWIKKKEYNENSITFMEGLKHGLSVTFYAASLSMISFFIFAEFINPNFFSSMIEYQVGNYIEAGYTEDDALDFVTSRFNIKDYLFNTFIMTMGVGSMSSLLGAFILKNKEATSE